MKKFRFMLSPADMTGQMSYKYKGCRMMKGGWTDLNLNNCAFLPHAQQQNFTVHLGCITLLF